MIVIIAIVGIVGAFYLGLLVGRKNPKVADTAASVASEAEKKL